jgi:hypothetical protein
MFKTFALAALSSLAVAETYSAHDSKAEIDSANSTKEYGLVLWQPFFDTWAKAESLGAAPAAYDFYVHACYFIWQATQWATSYNDDRYAIVVTQNCPAALIASFDFTVTFSGEKHASDTHVLRTGAAGESVATKDDVASFSVTEWIDSPDYEVEAIWLNDDTNSTIAAINFGYTYLVVLPAVV